MAEPVLPTSAHEAGANVPPFIAAKDSASKPRPNMSTTKTREHALTAVQDTAMTFATNRPIAAKTPDFTTAEGNTMALVPTAAQESSLMNVFTSDDSATMLVPAIAVNSTRPSVGAAAQNGDIGASSASVSDTPTAPARDASTRQDTATALTASNDALPLLHAIGSSPTKIDGSTDDAAMAQPAIAQPSSTTVDAAMAQPATAALNAFNDYSPLPDVTNLPSSRTGGTTCSGTTCHYYDCAWKGTSESFS